MTTATEEKVELKASAWTPEQEATIQKYLERGMRRSNAVRKMRTDEAKAGLKAKLLQRETPAMAAATETKLARVNAKLAKAKPARKAEKAERTEITPQKQVHIDELVRKEIGKGCAVEGVYKSSLSPNFSRYIWYGISDGRVLSVNPDSMQARFLDPSSKSAKGWLKMQARAAKREEANRLKREPTN